MKKVNNSGTQVVILCGGKSVRFREKTAKIPKPLVEIGGKPILWHIMKIYQAQGFNNFLLACGYKYDLFKKFARTYAKEFNVQAINTGEDTLKGGRIYRLRKYIATNPFMCTYGDGLANINLKKLLAFHKRIQKVATITCVRPNSQFGILKIKNNIVESFVEKPQHKDWINGGFFVFAKEIFEYLNRDCDLESKPFEKLAKISEMAAFRHRGYWNCMDTVKDFQSLEEMYNGGRAYWKTW
jgi:glucose-1-phosphate cytidylyltransferase